MGVVVRKVLLVGNPNCGKTTIFNLLTGSTQRIGNWPGVTVEKKQGYCELSKQKFEIVDLPGVYSLNVDDSSAQDNIITAREVEDKDVDLIVNVVDACHLERHLYLTTQLLEIKKPLILVVNMLDIAKNRQININQELLAKKLNCSVVFMQANKKFGMDDLQRQLVKPIPNLSAFKLNFPKDINKIIEELSKKIIINDNLDEDIAYFKAYRQLETMDVIHSGYPEDIDILMADTRYTAINAIINTVQKNSGKQRDNLTAKIDKIVLNRFFALPIFVGIMYFMFLFSINLGGVFRDFFDIATDAIFVKGAAYLLTKAHSKRWLISIFAYGIGRGINTTASFIPVIFMMYFFLTLLESSGYMARAAFVIDRVMRLLGLPGKSFVPMIVGFGCNVPGIMAARTLESERDRILTVLMSPFMSCSARLAIYVVFVSAFFPSGGQNIVFSLYLIGILMAVFTGFILKKTFLTGSTSPLIIELPTYHLPTLFFLLKDTYTRLRFFLIRAGKLIIPICILLSIMDSWLISIGNEEISIIAYFGKKLVPLFAPMGIGVDNWPAVVGLITGTLAKEVVVGTLNSLYSHTVQLNPNDFNFLYEIKSAFSALHANIVNFGAAFSNPFAASVNKTDLSATAYGVMIDKFHTKIAAYAYLLFVLLYIPCISTMAAIKQETARKYMLFSIIWSVVLAYIVASVFYQVGTWYYNTAYGVNFLFFTGILMVSLFIIYIWRRLNAMPIA